MCRYTSWLVLENEEAYKRHHIERKRREQQATRQDAPVDKGPLKKAKLKDGESVSDFLKDFKEGGEGEVTKGSGMPGTIGEADKKEEKMMVMSPKPSIAKPDAAPMAEMEYADEVSSTGVMAPMERKKIASKARRSKPKPVPKTPRISFAEQIKQMDRSIESSPRSPYHRVQLVALLVGRGKTDQAREKVDGWLQEFRLNPDDLVSLVAPALERLPDDKWSRNKRVELFRLALEARPDSPELLTYLVDALVRAGRKKEAFDLLEKERLAAKTDNQRLLALIPGYGKVVSLPRAKKALLEISGMLVKNRPMDSQLRRVHLEQLKVAGLQEEALRAIVDWRRYAPNFPELVIEHVRMLQKQSKIGESERVLSELVEFNPHDFDARTAYARALTGEGGYIRKARTTQACEQYTLAVQLNPSKRDTFRTMMSMRRSHPKAAKAIYKCITEGVSRLPVIRDVSMVMIWEDPSVDVDLHVLEPGGEDVYYQHMESAQGGHLYYDVTDGYGPEIYVLGSGKPGTYRLSVVYYSGSTRTVRGKLIVLRHAGGPEETRKVYKFTLPRSNSDKKIPVGTFKISR